MTITHDNRFIITGSYDCSLKFWDLQTFRTKAFSSVIRNMSSLQHLGLPYSTTVLPIKVQSATQLADGSLHLLGQNVLHYISLCLPDVHYSLLKPIEAARVKFAYDTHGNTPLDYLMAYKGQSPIHTQQFRKAFFEMLPTFINYGAINISSMLISLAKHNKAVLQQEGTSVYISYIQTFIFDAQELLHNGDLLPIQGEIVTHEKRCYIPQKSLAATDSAISQKLIFGSRASTTLQYTAIGCPMSKDTLEVMDIVHRAEGNKKIFSLPLTTYMIDFYWKKYTPLMWLELLFHIIPLLFLTVYAVMQHHEDSQYLLIPLLAIVVVYAIFELGEAWLRLGDYLSNVWNWIDVAYILVQFVLTVVAWTQGSTYLLRILVSVAIILSYTKMLVLMRVIDQIRHFVRMLLEILSDSLSFFVVVLIDIVAFALAMFQARLPIDREEDETDATYIESFGRVLLEVFVLFFGDWDTSNYSAITLPFFVIVAVLLALIMLNMIIAIMGDTFDRVQDNLKLVDSREKLSMLRETMVMEKKIGYLLSRLHRWLRMKDSTLSCASYECAESSIERAEDIYRANLSEKPFILVIRPYQNEGDDDEDSEWGGKLNELKKELRAVQESIQEKLQCNNSELHVLKERLEVSNTKLDTASLSIGSNKQEVKDMTSAKFAEMSEQLEATSAKIEEIRETTKKEVKDTEERLCRYIDERNDKLLVEIRSMLGGSSQGPI